MADGKIEKGSIVKMKEYEAGKVKDKRSVFPPSGLDVTTGRLTLAMCLAF